MLHGYYERLAAFLEAQDKLKGDLSYRLQGAFQAATLFAESVPTPEEVKIRITEAVINACKHFGIAEMIDRRSGLYWPTDRYAVAFLNALGVRGPRSAE